MTATEDRSTPKFTFQHLEGRQFPYLEGKDFKEYLTKWSMGGRIRAQGFSFDPQFQLYEKNDFALAFFQDPVVYGNLQVVSDSGKWNCLGSKASRVEVEQLACSVLSMSFFDRLQENGIVRESGHICKCFDDYYEDFTISDKLRECLLLEESDHYHVFSDSDRLEFLFQLFKHLCLGGSVCQYEDTVHPYLESTKLLYKDLVSVTKDDSGKLHIISNVLKVRVFLGDEVIYPSSRENIQNFAYLIIDPLKRNVIVLYHNFGASVFS